MSTSTTRLVSVSATTALVFASLVFGATATAQADTVTPSITTVQSGSGGVLANH